jgi:hypothetical protein
MYSGVTVIDDCGTDRTIDEMKTVGDLHVRVTSCTTNTCKGEAIPDGHTGVPAQGRAR